MSRPQNRDQSLQSLLRSIVYLPFTFHTQLGNSRNHQRSQQPKPQTRFESKQAKHPANTSQLHSAERARRAEDSHCGPYGGAALPAPSNRFCPPLTRKGPRRSSLRGSSARTPHRRRDDGQTERRNLRRCRIRRPTAHDAKGARRGNIPLRASLGACGARRPHPPARLRAHAPEAANAGPSEAGVQTAHIEKRPPRARRPALPQPCAAVLSAKAGLTAGFGMGPGDPRLCGRARGGRSPAAQMYSSLPGPLTGATLAAAWRARMKIAHRARCFNRGCEELGLLVPLG